MFNSFRQSICMLLVMICCFSTAYAESKYYLCGPDEDGCPKNGRQYCACIPYDAQSANKPFCLDFNLMTCVPLTQAPNCDPGFIFQDQGTCLATIFQSEPEPPCKLKSESFCMENHTYLCDKTGNPKSCHPT